MMQAERLAAYFHMDETTQPQEVMGLKDKGPDEDAENGGERDEEDDGSDDDTATFREMTSFENFYRSRSCTICTVVALSLLAIASVVALVTVAVLVASPYQRAAGFHLAKCHVTSTAHDKDDKICSCGKGCNAEFPCLHIMVRYTTFQDEVIVETLYENEANLRQEVGIECSFFPPCRSSRSANQRAVAGYERNYGQPGSSYPCLYNPDNPREVIRTRRFQVQHVIHGLLWSSLVFLVSVGLLIMAIRRRGCEFL